MKIFIRKLRLVFFTSLLTSLILGMAGKGYCQTSPLEGLNFALAPIGQAICFKTHKNVTECGNYTFEYTEGGGFVDTAVVVPKGVEPTSSEVNDLLETVATENKSGFTASRSMVESHASFLGRHFSQGSLTTNYALFYPLIDVVGEMKYSQKKWIVDDLKKQLDNETKEYLKDPTIDAAILRTGYILDQNDGSLIELQRTIVFVKDGGSKIDFVSFDADKLNTDKPVVR